MQSGFALTSAEPFNEGRLHRLAHEHQALSQNLSRELCRVFEEAYESVCMAPRRMAHEALKPGLKPLTGFRLKAGLRQGVSGAPGLVSTADAEVGVPASAGSKRRPSGLGDSRVTVIRAPGIVSPSSQGLRKRSSR
jgi:hypothetical protein